ncbi:hypothetical protein [Halorarius litoreus]|uniref:hypothetical protein n=1 Tax=Halorarius litoreus TaxID=2962676 RepID=UPI0020CBB6ED|nr:hypothetical protein [Halorarius litoreus]
MRLALDIETVSPDLDPQERPDFRDSADFELLAVALGYESEDGDTETTILFREGTGAATELDLLERTLDWLDDRPADTLLTYNGEAFDLLHLRGRARLASEALGAREHVAARLDAALDDLVHDDLRNRAVDRFGGRPTFESACERVGVAVPETRWADYEHGQDPTAWRGATGTHAPGVKNTDVPQFGERYLALADADATHTLTFRELERLLTDYARSDVAPLFRLADAL